MTNNNRANTDDPLEILGSCLMIAAILFLALFA